MSRLRGFERHTSWELFGKVSRQEAKAFGARLKAEGWREGVDFRVKGGSLFVAKDTSRAAAQILGYGDRPRGTKREDTMLEHPVMEEMLEAAGLSEARGKGWSWQPDEGPRAGFHPEIKRSVERLTKQLADKLERKLGLYGGPSNVDKDKLAGELAGTVLRHLHAQRSG